MLKLFKQLKINEGEDSFSLFNYNYLKGKTELFCQMLFINGKSGFNEHRKILTIGVNRLQIFVF